MSYSHQHLQEAAQIISQLDPETCERAVRLLSDVRARGGRLFILGVGGSAANASHAVNDFRKIAGFESYAPTDNVSELTARTNDEGWPSVFAEWLKGSRLSVASSRQGCCANPMGTMSFRFLSQSNAVALLWAKVRPCSCLKNGRRQWSAALPSLGLSDVMEAIPEKWPMW